MSLTLTLALLAAALGMAVFAGWRGSRPWDLTRGVRMIPWRFIMLLSGVAILILTIHLGTLMGVPQRPY
ncbi:hypothetical protein [Brevundimonas sp. UBA2416]|uniref:hypothetical protein n=1 Tax=Brevundimonas sp. UBA2416 TaxID=1946124 RepID=UPI0025BC3D2C|nr:hypothetical protein [Brevundimonas sp. UBA2416]HRJ63595.1 hypothetical protein [Brevundimonas sp.]